MTLRTVGLIAGAVLVGAGAGAAQVSLAGSGNRNALRAQRNMVAHGTNFFSNCRFSHAAPDDPIVHPRMPGASHPHEFFGNTSTNSKSTLATLRAWYDLQPVGRHGCLLGTGSLSKRRGRKTARSQRLLPDSIDRPDPSVSSRPEGRGRKCRCCEGAVDEDRLLELCLSAGPNRAVGVSPNVPDAAAADDPSGPRIGRASPPEHQLS